MAPLDFLGQATYLGVVKVFGAGDLHYYFLFVMYFNEHPLICQQLLFKLEIENVSIE